MAVKDERVVWVNGELIPWAAATVPLLSHGFSRASAVFEVFGVHESPDGLMAFRMDEHLKRLRRSAELLEMELSCTEEEIAAAAAQSVRANGMGRGIVKIMAYWSEEAVVNLVLDSKLDVAVFAIPASEELHLDDTTPISACLSTWRKLHAETVQVESKACANYLNAYLVRREATRRGYDVAVLLDTEGFLAEGTTESIFLVQDGVLRTPPRGRILNSISRMSLLEMAPAVGIRVEERAMRVDALYAAEEIFTAHTGVKVHPVHTFEERRLEAPGPVTIKLLELMDDTLNFRTHAFDHFFQRLS